MSPAPTRPERILNLGGGGQSTTMALMADRGELAAGRPDLAIYADTGWDPDSTRATVAWIQSMVSYPVETVQHRDLRNDLVTGRDRDGVATGFEPIPAYVRKADGRVSISKRQCTTNYKIWPIQRRIRQLWGVNRMPAHAHVETWLGISLDEVGRMKTATKHLSLIHI